MTKRKLIQVPHLTIICSWWNCDWSVWGGVFIRFFFWSFDFALECFSKYFKFWTNYAAIIKRFESISNATNILPLYKTLSQMFCTYWDSMLIVARSWATWNVGVVSTKYNYTLIMNTHFQKCYVDNTLNKMRRHISIVLLIIRIESHHFVYGSCMPARLFMYLKDESTFLRQMKTQPVEIFDDRIGLIFHIFSLNFTKWVVPSYDRIQPWNKPVKCCENRFRCSYNSP